MKYAVLIGAFALLGSAAGWAGQEVFGPAGMLLCLVLGLGTAALFAHRRKQAEPASRPWRWAPIWGSVLALGLYTAGTTLWSVNDILLNSNRYLGTQRLVEKSLLGVGLGLIVGLVVAAHVRRPRRRWGRWLSSLLLTLWLGLFLTLFVLYLARTGVRDRSLYPPRETSPYKLPWPGGVTLLCSQGNWAIITHRGMYPYAFDFPMPIGSPVCAARGGVVVESVDVNDGNGVSKPGNGITIQHDDGTRARYWHIRHGGSRVSVGQRVRQGEVIAESGNVGYSTSPHLHFEVYTEHWFSTPVSFSDVEVLGGIPRMGLRYTSGNYPPD